MVSRTTGRDTSGRFAKGCPGGPGRPRRAVEQEYLAALADVCTLEAWRQICARAVLQAMEGDARAREWLAGYLMGGPPTLLDLAAQERVPQAIETEVTLRAQVITAGHEQRQDAIDFGDPLDP